MIQQVRVGVGCFVRNTLINCNEVLVGVRKGSHGAGKLSLPGGHLEMGESWETCAMREIKEEANLLIDNVKFLTATNDIYIDGNPDKHYVTIFMEADVAPDSPPLVNMEPEKCETWKWIDIDKLASLSESDSEGMFEPLMHFFQNNGKHTLLPK